MKIRKIAGINGRASVWIRDIDALLVLRTKSGARMEFPLEEEQCGKMEINAIIKAGKVDSSSGQFPMRVEVYDAREAVLALRLRELAEDDIDAMGQVAKNIEQQKDLLYAENLEDVISDVIFDMSGAARKKYDLDQSICKSASYYVAGFITDKFRQQTPETTQ